jgi:hypothetical protein
LYFVTRKLSVSLAVFFVRRFTGGAWKGCVEAIAHGEIRWLTTGFDVAWGGVDRHF